MQQDQQGSAEHLPLQNLQAQAGLRPKYSAIMLVQKRIKQTTVKLIRQKLRVHVWQQQYKLFTKACRL